MKTDLRKSCAALAAASVITCAAVAQGQVAWHSSKENFGAGEKSGAVAKTDGGKQDAAEGRSEHVDFMTRIMDELSSGSLEGALGLFEQLPDSLREDLDIQVIHASLLLSAGKVGEAGAIATELLRDNKDNLDVLELQLSIAGASGDRRAQENTIRSILAIDPYNPRANIRQAEIHVLSRKYKLAANSYSRALKNDQDNGEAIFGYAQMCYYLNSLDVAKKYLTRLIELEPANAYAYAYLGKVVAEESNYFSASSYIDKAIALEPQNYDFYIDQGSYERYKGNFDAAAAAWSKAISLKPDYFLAYTYRAGIYDEQGKYAEALSDYKSIVRTNPKYYFAYEQMGVLAWHEKQWADARNAFKEALKYYEKNYAYILLVAASYWREGNVLEMKNFLAKEMKTMAKDSVEYQLVRLFHDQGPASSESNVASLINKEQGANKKGKLKYYLALYYELKGNTKVSDEYYSQILGLAAPMFFEYRMAEWSMGDI